jgi:hypothetical protein
MRGKLRLKRPRLALALVALAFLGYVVQRGANRGSDFRYPYGAARLLWTSGAFNVRAQPRYPVTLHVMLGPLTRVPLGVAVAVWAGLSVAATAVLPLVLARLSGVEPRRQWPAWALAGPFFVDALVLGQFDPVNVFLVSAGLLAAKEERAALGAGLVGLAGLVKILPFLQWATVLSLTRSRGVWLGMVLAVALGFGLLAAAAGPGAALAAVGEQIAWVRDHEKPWHLVERGTDLRTNNESLPIVLARTFGALPPGRLDPRAVSLARLPLGVVWATWWAVLAVLVVGWLASVGPARRVPPERGWLAMFALTSVMMLAASPICWNHYFLWTLPAALFLLHRPRLVLGAAALSMLGTASHAARGVGIHIWMAFVLFAVVVWDLRGEGRHAVR